MIQVVYVAGPYRAKTPFEVECNIHAARRLGAEVAKLGGLPLIPHANTAHFDGIQDDQFWLDGTLELLRRADAVIMLHNWERSTGARGEHAEAERLRIPIFYQLDRLAIWLHLRKGAA